MTPEEAEYFSKIMEEIGAEENLTRKKLLALYLFSHIADVSKNQSSFVQSIPQYICEALGYIDAHFCEKITSKELVEHIHIGRTTLMTEFKKHTGNTVHEYIMNCRIRNAIKLLSEGKTEFDAAVSSGFSDASSLIQCFKRVLRTTPRQYIKNI